MEENKKEMLEAIKRPYRIIPIFLMIGLILTVFILMFMVGLIVQFGRELTSDFVGVLINLFFAWNFGFALYIGIWQFFNSRKINKILFSQLEKFIDESESKSYVETEADEMITVAYSGYNKKYEKLKKVFWTCFKISILITAIALMIELVYVLMN